MYKIAKEHGITVQQLKTWNKLSSNFIYTGNKLIVSDPSKTTPKPVPAPKPTPTPKPAPTPAPTNTPKTYTVQKGDYLYKIAQLHGVTVNDLKLWNNLTSNYIYTGNQLIVSPTNTNLHSLTTSGQRVQKVLDGYKHLQVNVHYQSLSNGDHSTAGLRADTSMTGQSMPKIVFAAYAQELVEKGLLKWDHRFTYNRNVNSYSNAYPTWGTGTIHNSGYGKSYALKDIVQRTMAQSDNVGANMLRHYICTPRQSDFDKFVNKVYGAQTWSWQMTPKQGNRMISYLQQQKEQVAFNALKSTWWDNTRLDVLPVHTHQKVGYYNIYNHSTGYVASNKPYAITVMSKYLNNANAKIAEIAKKVYSAVMSQ